MALNFGLLDTNAPAAIANSVTQGQQMAQQEKLGQMRMESAQLDLDKVKREAVGLQRMQQLFMENGKSPDMRTNFTEMIKSGVPHFMDIGFNGLKALEEQDRYQEYIRKGQPTNTMAAPEGAPANAMATPAAAPVNAMAAPAPAAAPAPVNALNAPNRTAQIQQEMAELSAFPNVPGAKARLKVLEKELEEAVKAPVYHNVQGVGLVDPRTGRVITPSVETAPTEIKKYEYAKKQGYKGSLFEFEREMANASRTPAQPAAPVAVVDAAGNTIYVTREEALRNRMTPAGQGLQLPPKEIQKREASYPQATSAVKTVSNTMSAIEQAVDRLLANEEGLNGVTGLVGGRTPALTDAARKAQADLEQLKNLAFVQGLTELRAASKTGAGVGNVTNKEGDRFENLKASLDRTQSLDDMISSLKRLKDSAQFTTATMKEAYDDTYSYRASKPVATGSWSVVK